MAVTLCFGGKPVPKGWHLWNNKCRPAPGRLFFELRFHHTGEWKLTLDFRPVDGVMPSFWMPPFAWKYAAELEAVQKHLEYVSDDTVLKNLGKMLNVHPSNYEAMKLAILDYGQKWKNKKKLLFGASEGLGMQEHAIDADYVLQGWDWSEPITGEGISKKLVEMMVVGAKEAQEKKLETKFVYKALVPLMWQGKSYVPGEYLPGDNDGTVLHALGGNVEQLQTGMMPFHSAKGWTMKGSDWPEGYDIVPFDTMVEGMKAPQVNLSLRITLMGAEAAIAYKGWQITARVDYRKDGAKPLKKPAQLMVMFTAPGESPTEPPKIEVNGVYILQMSKEIIRLGIGWVADKIELPMQEIEFNPDVFPQLFPPQGLVTAKPYWVPNPKYQV
jgi:hypothetical protein